MPKSLTTKVLPPREVLRRALHVVLVDAFFPTHVSTKACGHERTKKTKMLSREVRPPWQGGQTALRVLAQDGRSGK
jgi:hypothetical protein